MAGKTESAIGISAQTAPRVTADGYVRKPSRARRAGLARPAEGRTGVALLGLMTRLILEHARATAAPTMAGGGRMIADKICAHHLERKAILYVRQSSPHQVLHNRESGALQYAMCGIG